MAKNQTDLEKKKYPVTDEKSSDIIESTNKVKKESKEHYHEPFKLQPDRQTSNDHSSLSSNEMTYV